MKSRLLLVLAVSALLLTGALAAVQFLGAEPEVNLTAMPETAYLTLTAAQPTQIQVVTVRPGTTALTVRSARDANVTLTLTNPAGTTITPDNADSHGATYTTDTSPAGALANQVQVTDPAAGPWTIRYQLTGPGTGRAVLETLVSGTDTLNATVVVDYDQVAGRPFPVSVAAFQGTIPLTDAQVELTLTNWATRETLTVPARDDGNREAGDLRSGDGLYSALVDPLDPAFYLAAATVTSGGPVQETVKTSNFFTVNSATALLAGTVTDDGVDDDGDGLLDRIVLHFPIREVQRAGQYVIDAVISTPDGRELDTNAGTVRLAPGMTQADIFFDAKEIRDTLGQNGPYAIRRAQFSWMPATPDIQPAAHLIQEFADLGQTRAYQLTALKQAAIQSGRFLADRGVDTNGNGQFDVIEVQFELISVLNMNLSWNADLGPVTGLPAGGRAPTASGQGVLTPGVNVVTLRFDVAEYGLNRVAGPYTLTGLTVTPNEPWPSPFSGWGFDELYALADPLGQTTAYQPRQLERGPRSDIASLIEYVRGMTISSPGASSQALRSAWLNTLNRALEEQQAGRIQQATQQLGTFIQQIQAQAGQAISVGDAHTLEQMTQDVVAALQATS